MYKMYFFLSQWKPIVTKWTLLSYIHYMEETEKLNTKCQLGRDKFPIFPIICQYLQGTVNIYYKYFEVIKQLVIRALNRFVLRYLPNLRHLHRRDWGIIWGVGPVRLGHLSPLQRCNFPCLLIQAKNTGLIQLKW